MAHNSWCPYQMWVAILNGGSYVTMGRNPEGGQLPWGSEVPLVYQTSERSSPIGTGNLGNQVALPVYRSPIFHECNHG